MSEKLSGKCPSCGALLVYEKGATSVMCNACDIPHSVAELETGAKTTPTGNTFTRPSFGGYPMMVGFDNPESGIVYLENFFDGYNWKEYQESAEIEILEIAEVVENNKIKNGAQGSSWYLVFKSIAVPVAKKIEGLKEQAAEIGRKYNAEDSSESIVIFDNYSKIITTLVNCKNDIIKKLLNAVKYAEKYALDALRLIEIKKELKEVKDLLDTLKIVKTIEEVPEYIVAQKKVDIALAKVFTARGINAEAVYEEALALYNEGGLAKRDSLIKFETVRGYKDSVRYIDKINKYFNFEELFHFCDKYYIYKKEQFAVPALNVSKLGKKGKQQPEEQQTVSTAFTLYEVVNGVPSDNAIIKGIEKFITCYNNKYYYFKKDQGIFCYDLSSKTEVCVDAGKTADYVDDGEYQILPACNYTTIIVKKKLHPIEKKGCLGGDKKKTEDEKILNNYCLLSINLLTGVCKTVINELVDIADTYNKEIFYIYAERIEKDHKQKHSETALGEEEKEYNTILMVCDLVSGVTQRVLNEGCEIHTVVEKRIVYSIWKPNSQNIDIRVFDMNTGKDVLIEDNAYRFFGVFDNRIYFTIGNRNYRPFISNNFEGTNRVEIMKNVENVIDVRAGWLYVKKGYGDNSVLLKVSMDGTRRILICAQLKKIVKTTPTHIYFIDAFDTLRVVRKDGVGNRIIGEDITQAIVEKDYLFYVRREKVDEKSYNLSLYRMDIDGRNVKKLVFDLTNFNNFDEKSLYYFKKESLRFKVIVPVGNGKTEEHYERHHVTRYFRFDKETGISEVVLTLGLPSAKKNSYKAGCFGKTVEGDVIYEEVPEVREFRRKGLHAVGEVEAEAEAEKKTNATLFSGNNPASNSGCSSSNNNSGCSSSNNNSGCSSSNNNSGCASTTKR